MPADEFKELMLWETNGGEHVYRKGGQVYFIQEAEVETFLEEYGEDYVIDATDRFSYELLPGFMDGDYPPWLDATAEDLLPQAFIERYGHHAVSHLNGSWWEFPVDAFKEMAVELKKEGLSVTANL